jgi:branched-chain amino acid transport system ATP-binding protein
MVPPNQTGESIMNTWFRQKKIKQEEQDILEKTNDVLDFLQLKHIANEYAGNLSGGQKKLLELGRTMMVKPKIVLLDEVGAGVNRTLLNTIGDAILRLNKDLNYTFCMIEHDIDFISRLCDPVIVMAEGSILMTDEISKVRKNEEVIEVYLGKN